VQSISRNGDNIRFHLQAADYGINGGDRSKMKKSGFESPLRVLKTRSTIHPHAQRNAFRRRGVHRQSRSFAPEDQGLIRSPNFNRLC